MMLKIKRLPFKDHKLFTFKFFKGLSTKVPPIPPPLTPTLISDPINQYLSPETFL